LNQLICGGDGHKVRQLLLELHFQKNLGLANDHDVLIAGKAIKCLWEDGWGMVTQESSGANPDDSAYTRGIVDYLPHKYFLMYTALQRLDPNSTGTLRYMWDDWHSRYQAGRRKFGNSWSTHNMSKFPDIPTRMKPRYAGQLPFDTTVGYVN
jgi:hypothetical protein